MSLMNFYRDGIYPARPSHIVPGVLATVFAVSALGHAWQNQRYGFWKVTGPMVYGSIIYIIGWAVLCAGSYHVNSVDLYAVQDLFIQSGPPIFSLATYLVLTRIMKYVPMHVPGDPLKWKYFFLYQFLIIEVLAFAASLSATLSPLLVIAPENFTMYDTGYSSAGIVLCVAALLQALTSLCVITLTAMIHRRASRAKMITSKVRNTSIMLYGTSILMMLRCVIRSIQAVEMATDFRCTSVCWHVSFNEIALYAFDAGPMILITLWMHLAHPGRFLPRDSKRYLDTDGKTERLGPGLVDERRRWVILLDPYGILPVSKDQMPRARFWLHPEDWPVASDGLYTFKAASISSTRSKLGSTTYQYDSGRGAVQIVVQSKPKN